MALATPDSLPDGRRVRAAQEQLFAIIGFKNERVRTREPLFHEVGHVTQIGCNSELAPAVADHITYGVFCVMIDAEPLNLKFAKGHVIVRFDDLIVRKDTDGFRKIVEGTLRQIHRDLGAPGEGAESEDVIAVFVGDEDRPEGVKIFADGGGAFEEAFMTQAAIDEDSSFGVTDEQCIAGTAAAEEAESNHVGFPTGCRTLSYNDGRTTGIPQNRASIPLERGRVN